MELNPTSPLKINKDHSEIRKPLKLNKTCIKKVSKVYANWGNQNSLVTVKFLWTLHIRNLVFVNLENVRKIVLVLAKKCGLA